MGIFDRIIYRFLHALRNELYATLCARDELPLERYDLDLLAMIDRLGGFQRRVTIGHWSGGAFIPADGIVFAAARRG